MHNIDNTDVYLARMAKPLAEKLKITRFFPEKFVDCLDVGCADGVVTREMAKMFPQASFRGIDLSEEFVNKARQESTDIPNIAFETVYLRDLLIRPKRYDVVTFCSVLHEFFSYGEGISSIVKALADSHELLHKGGVIVIRDMILSNYTKHSNLFVESMVAKVKKNTDLHSYIEDFEKKFGKLNDIYTLNHYLLKYKYTENWEREAREHYVPVTFDEYEKIFSLLDMKVLFKSSETIPFLNDQWSADFGFSEAELSTLRSTGFIVAQK